MFASMPIEYAAKKLGKKYQADLILFQCFETKRITLAFPSIGYFEVNKSTLLLKNYQSQGSRSTRKYTEGLNPVE